MDRTLVSGTSSMRSRTWSAKRTPGSRRIMSKTLEARRACPNAQPRGLTSVGSGVMVLETLLDPGADRLEVLLPAHHHPGCDLHGLVPGPVGGAGGAQRPPL